MRHVCTGSFHVALPPDRAAALFTPEGERAWAYDLTALADEERLAAFAAGFDAMLAGWERDIAAAVAGAGGGRVS